MLLASGNADGWSKYKQQQKHDHITGDVDTGYKHLNFVAVCLLYVMYTTYISQSDLSIWIAQLSDCSVDN